MLGGCTMHPLCTSFTYKFILCITVGIKQYTDLMIPIMIFRSPLKKNVYLPSPDQLTEKKDWPKTCFSLRETIIFFNIPSSHQINTSFNFENIRKTVMWSTLKFTFKMFTPHRISTSLSKNATLWCLNLSSLIIFWWLLWK